MADRSVMMSGRPTPQRMQGNRRIALALALFSFGVFASFIVHQWLASS